MTKIVDDIFLGADVTKSKDHTSGGISTFYIFIKKLMPNELINCVYVLLSLKSDYIQEMMFASFNYNSFYTADFVFPTVSCIKKVTGQSNWYTIFISLLRCYSPICHSK